MLRGEDGKLGQEFPLDIKELLKKRGLTVVMVDGDVGCYGEYVGVNDTMIQSLNSEEKEKQLTNEQITHGVLEFMKCKSETPTTPTKIRLPVKYNEGVMRPLITQKMVDKAKKKLKKLQKRQRKQDNQGVSNTDVPLTAENLQYLKIQIPRMIDILKGEESYEKGW